MNLVNELLLSLTKTPDILAVTETRLNQHRMLKYTIITFITLIQKLRPVVLESTYLNAIK